MKKLLRYSVLLVCTLILLEFSTRFVYDRPWTNGYSYNKYTGTFLTPDTTGWWTREGRGFVSINSFGMRDDREYSPSKDVDTIRIAVVGDSYVEAIQVNVQDTFWRLTERKLNKSCPIVDKRKIEILPFGVSGHGPAQYLLNVQHRVLKFSPDLVLVLFTPGNDFRNSIESIENDPLRPYLLEQKENTEYTWDFSFRTEAYARSNLPHSSWIKRVLSKSTLISLFDEISSRLKSVQMEKEKNSTEVKNVHEINPDLGDNYMFLDYQSIPSKWQESRRVVSEVVARMKLLESPNLRVIGVVGTSGSQVHPDPQAREAFADYLGVSDLMEPSRYFDEVFRKNNLGLIDLYRDLSNSALETGSGMHGEAPSWGGHWNKTGHMIVSDILTRKICQLLNSQN